MNEERGSNALTAAFLLGFYFVLINWYRTRLLAAEGTENATPSQLILLFSPARADGFALLGYLHQKALLFTWMMLCLLAIGLLYFEISQKWSRVCLAGVWLQVFSLVLWEQRMWVGSVQILLFLSAVFLLGRCRTKAFLVGLSLFGALFGGQMLAWAALVDASYALLGVLALTLAAMVWEARLSDYALRATIAATGLYGWLTFQEHWFAFALLVLVCQQTRARESNTSRSLQIGVVLMAVLNAALTFGLWPQAPLGQHWLRFRTPAIVRSDWVFSKGPVKQSLLVKTSLDERGRISRTEIVDPASNEAIAAELKVVDSTLFSRRWYRKTNPTLLVSSGFYRVLRNKAKQSAPEWDVTLKVSIEFKNGKQKLWLLP